MKKKPTVTCSNLRRWAKWKTKIKKISKSKKKITGGLKSLEGRSIKCDGIQQKPVATTDRQVSTSDPESRSMLLKKTIVEVASNVQNAADGKHNLIVHSEATNTNNDKAL